MLASEGSYTEHSPGTNEKKPAPGFMIAGAGSAGGRNRSLSGPHRHFTISRCSRPEPRSRFFAFLLSSLIFRRRSFTESALRSASS